MGYTHTQTRIYIYAVKQRKGGLGALALCIVENLCINYSWPSVKQFHIHSRFHIYRFNQLQIM